MSIPNRPRAPGNQGGTEGKPAPAVSHRIRRLRMVCRGMLVILAAVAGCQILSMEQPSSSKYVDAIMAGMKRAHLAGEARRAGGGS